MSVLPTRYASRVAALASDAPVANRAQAWLTLGQMGEPVGRGADVPDEGRDRHDGWARPRSEERTERALRARDNRLSFRVPS